MGTPDPARSSHPTCSAEGCDAPLGGGGKGLCSKHYQRLRRLGTIDDSALSILVHLDAGDRLMARVVQGEGGCWLWTGALNASGYGVIQAGGRAQRAHRFAYELFVGPIPAGFHLDHTCRVRACCNPDHLEPVTTQENSRRGQSARTTCRNGHTYDEENTIWRLVRVCRCCVQTSRHRRPQ